MTFQPRSSEIDAAPPRWPAPQAAASLYAGTVMHARLKPVVHRFAYSVFSLLIDIERLDEAARMSRLFSVNRANVVSFRERDHLDGRNGTLGARARNLLAQANITEPPARILLACYPRVFGYVFNPLSVYYAYAGDDRLLALIYAVRNTFGESHTYVCPVDPGEASAAGIRQTCDKLFHVSPFIAMQARYHFRMRPPGDDIRWRILETDAEGPLLSATYAGSRMPLSSRSLATVLCRTPLMTWKIIAGIHFEAVRLFLKGVAYIPKPAPPAAVSFKNAKDRGR